jgi:hypothetical protein
MGIMAETFNKNFDATGKSGTIDGKLLVEVKKLIANDNELSIFSKFSGTIDGDVVKVIIPYQALSGVDYSLTDSDSQTAAGEQLEFKLNNFKNQKIKVSNMNNIGNQEYFLAIQSEYVASGSATIVLSLYCEFIEAIKKSALSHPECQIVIPGADNPDATGVDFLSMAKQLRKPLRNMIQLFNRKYNGVNLKNQEFLISPSFKDCLTYGLMNMSVVSDKNYNDNALGGGNSISKYLGISTSVNNFLGTFVEEDKSFSNAKTFDFTDIHGILVHYDAMVFKYRVLSVHVVPQENQITLFEIGYAFVAGIYRPELIKAVLLTAQGSAAIASIQLLGLASKDYTVGTTSYTFQVIARDAANNIITTLPSDLAIANSGASGTVAATITYTAGAATGTIVFPNAGKVELKVSSATNTAINDKLTIKVNAA